jgi:hypothetical protein
LLTTLQGKFATAELNVHACVQGSDIHVAPGQEQHLPDEAWQIVQQLQGRLHPPCRQIRRLANRAFSTPI